ncbi:MAG: hypothetical protein AAB570_02495, partial [Patescibacteria group bacterium]
QGLLSSILKNKLESIESEEKLRLATIVHLAFWAGASRSEIALLKVRDFRTTRGRAFINLPKKAASKKIEVELPHMTGEIINRYFAVRNQRSVKKNESNQPLIASLRGHAHLSGWTIWHAVRKYQQRSRPKGSDTYQGLRNLRRNFVKLAVESGAQEQAISIHLRCQRVGLPEMAEHKLDVNALYSVIGQTISSG